MLCDSVMLFRTEASPGKAVDASSSSKPGQCFGIVLATKPNQGLFLSVSDSSQKVLSSG